MPRLRCQNWQSAAPPAMVPNKNGLISITFLTVCDAAGATEVVNERQLSVKLWLGGRGSALEIVKGPECFHMQQHRLLALTYICPLAGSGVHGHDDAVLEHKGQRCGPVVGLHVRHGVPLERVHLSPQPSHVQPKPCHATRHPASRIGLLTSWTCGSGKRCSGASHAASSPAAAAARPDGPARGSSGEKSSPRPTAMPPPPPSPGLPPQARPS